MGHPVRAGLELVTAVSALKAPVALQTRVGRHWARGRCDLIGAGQAQESGIVGETPTSRPGCRGSPRRTSEHTASKGDADCKALVVAAAQRHGVRVVAEQSPGNALSPLDRLRLEVVPSG